VNEDLEQQYRHIQQLQELSSKTSKKFDMVQLLQNDPNTLKYKITNDRVICKHLTKKECDSNIHCTYSNNRCQMAITKHNMIIFINKLSYMLVDNDIVYKEVFNIDEYYVSDIVDFNRFTHRDNQTIITNNNFSKILLKNVLGENNPVFSTKELSLNNDNYDELLSNLNKKYDIWEQNRFYIQEVYSNMADIRSYINCMYWSIHPYYNVSYRNLGYMNEIQNYMTLFLKGKLIEYIIDNNYEELQDKDAILDFIQKMNVEHYSWARMKIVYSIISKMHNNKIVVYDENFNVIQSFGSNLNSVIHIMVNRSSQYRFFSLYEKKN
jgi:hypothetical protein